MTTGSTAKFSRGIGFGTVHSSVLAPQGFIGATAPWRQDAITSYSRISMPTPMK